MRGRVGDVIGRIVAGRGEERSVLRGPEAEYGPKHMAESVWPKA